MRQPRAKRRATQSIEATPWVTAPNKNLQSTESAKQGAKAIRETMLPKLRRVVRPRDAHRGRLSEDVFIDSLTWGCVSFASLRRLTPGYVANSPSGNFENWAAVSLFTVVQRKVAQLSAAVFLIIALGVDQKEPVKA